MLVHQRVLGSAQISAAAQDFDLNSDGKLDISEVKVLLKAGKPSMKDREIEAILKKVDKTLGS